MSGFQRHAVTARPNSSYSDWIVIDIDGGDQLIHLYRADARRLYDQLAEVLRPGDGEAVAE